MQGGLGEEQGRPKRDCAWFCGEWTPIRKFPFLSLLVKWSQQERVQTFFAEQVPDLPGVVQASASCGMHNLYVFDKIQ